MINMREIFESTIGESVYNKNGIANSGGRLITVETKGVEIPVGIYTYNFTFKAEGENIISRKEKFEIIRNPDN